MRKGAVLTIAAVVSCGAVVATGQTQQAAPTVAVTAGPSAVSVAAPGPLGAGPTRFAIKRQGNKPVSVYLLLLNQGVSLGELKSALAHDDRTGGETALGLVWIQASVSLEGSETARGVSFRLRPGLTYVVISEPDTQSGPNGKVQKRGFTTFTTNGTPNGASAGRANATLRLEGLRFRGSGVLPRRGVVRIANRDGDAHIAIAFPVGKKVTSNQLGRALRSHRDQDFGRLIAGAPYALQNILSGGNTDDQEVRFPRAGRYALICFVHSHDELGMYRIVTVR